MPVCGVDDKVYGNTCLAEDAAGVEVACAIDTEKASADMVDGDLCSCEKKADGSKVDREDIIIFCPQYYQPVCGSDNKVYSNTCMADAAGAESECELPMDGEPLSGDDCKCPAEEMIFFVIPPEEEGGTPTRNPTTQVTFAT